VEDGPIEDEYEEMTVEEIFVGKVTCSAFNCSPKLTLFRDSSSLVCLALSMLTLTP